MKFKTLWIFARCITIELNTDSNYCNEERVEIFINGRFFTESDLNVISLYDLLPNTVYEISVKDKKGNIYSENIKTKEETVLLDVTKFGAKGDGIKSDAFAIQAAISACPPGGTVYVPAGTYLTGPVFLKSNISIYMEEGAKLVGITDRNEYPVLPGMTLCTDEKSDYNLGTWEGNPLDSFASLLTGIDVENVNIYGKGVVDGNSENSDWWREPKVRRVAWRPRLIYLCRCKNIVIEGLTFKNSPSWTIHPYYSEDIQFMGLNISNPYNSPNTDGIDPESCKNISIIGTKISVGDDCIAIKSGKYYMALNCHKPTENVVVRNCLLKSGHGSVTIGSECAGGVKDVFVSKCIFDATDRGLRIKTRRGRGKRGVLENIVFSSITMRDVRMPFTVNMFYFCDPDGHGEYCQSKEYIAADDMTPAIKDVVAKDITCSGVDVCLLCAYGLPESKVGLIKMENISAGFREKSARTPAVPVMMDGMEEMSGRGIYLRNIDKLSLKNIEISDCEDKEIDMADINSVASLDVKFL